MKPPALTRSDLMAGAEARVRSSGTVPKLENRILMQASSVPSLTPAWAASASSISSACPALQPSFLSSTQLKEDLFLFPSISSSIHSPSSVPSAGGHSAGEHRPGERSAGEHHPGECSAGEHRPGEGSAGEHRPGEGSAGGLSSGPGKEKERKRISEQDRQRSSEDVRSCREELTEDLDREDPVDPLPLSEMPTLEQRVSEEKEKWTVELAEEFGELETDSSDEEAGLLKDKKYKLLNMVCCSLVNKSCSPGQEGWDEKNSVWRKIRRLAEDITHSDAEFLLKVAVYTRQELNKHLLASYLLALAAYLPASKPHVRRYFCAAVRLPSDWLQVPRIYSMCFSSSLPTCLKKALVDKFKQFSEGQLAKYCTRQRRKPKAANNSPELCKKWAELLRSDTSTLQKQLQKKKSEFSMQNLIKCLHIKEPAEFVMSLLGKKYPADVKAFEVSGLSGAWQSDRAGQRMKLKQPDTWQTTLSREGNKAATWEKLIDTDSLPFVVMVKNLRNIITQGISAKHHDKILKRLTSESAVIQSKLLPLRFLNAYKVMTELRKFADAEVKVDSSKAVLQTILNRFKRGKHFRYMQWSSEGRKRLRVTMRVPFVYRLYSARRRLLQRASQRTFSQELLERYLQALLKAVQLSCTYNIPLIPGNTVISISNFSSGASWYKHFCPPADPSDNGEETDGSQLTTVPLAMMLRYGCEHSQVLITNSMDFQEADLSSDSFLDGVRDTVKQLEDSWNNEGWTSYINTFSKLSEKNMKLDNIILMTGDFMEPSLESELDKYRKKSSSDALVVNVEERPDKDKTYETRDPHTVYLFSISKEMLRLVSERGSSRLLDHVELIDKRYDIPPPAGVREKPERAADVVPLPATPALRWREVRVFISSAWRDMCAERNVLVRSVFPELRRRVAPHCLYLREVELRSGVTEEELARAVELCLEEVGRSQLMLGILGERYGPVLHRPVLTNLPQDSWLDSAPSDLSITELEIRQFQSLYPDSAQSRMLFYFRSPQLVSSVPVAWRADFTAESRESEAKLSDLKEWIRKNEFRVTENYPCEWAGAVDGRPSVKGLEEFAKAVMEDLWAALQKLFVEEVDEAGLINQQEMHQEAQRRHFHGRRKLVSMATGKVRECQQKGGILLVEGRPGVGKTAFMAAMAHALTTPACDAISYSTAANQSAGSAGHLLRCMVQMLRKMKEEEDELPPSISYRALLSEFHLHLAKPREGPLLVLLVDGADRVHDARGQVVSDWVPEHLPKGVCLVLSVTPDSALRNTLSKKKCCVLFPLGELPWPDRCEILQKELGVYGKELSDSASSKQLQTLLMKKGAGSPLYLRLACEELRNRSSFQEMKDSIQALPQSLCELVQHTLLRLQAQFGAAGLDWALAALTVSSAGLRERDVYALLNLCSDLSSTQRSPTWQETLQMARNPRSSQVPMIVLCQLTLSLRRLIQPTVSRSPDELLTLTNEDIRSAFQQCYVSTEEDLNRAHLMLAAHLWVRSDPHENDTFIHCDADALSHLLTHLMKCGQWGPMRFLLSSYHFLYANVRHGLLRPLLESFTLFSKRDTADKCSTEPSDDVDVRQCEDFLKRHAPLLSQWPALFVQQALNEAGDSPARAWAERIVQRGGVRALKWLNNTGHTQHQAGELVSTLPWDPSCVAVSPGGVFLVVGTEKGTLHIFLSDTRQEVKSLVSSCDGISGCIFLEECVVCITSYSGQVEVWDFHSGCRTARLDAHSRRITGCDVSSDRKHFATVSLDFSLKVWLSRGLRPVVSLLQPSPPNCVTLDPAGALVAVGCWDGAVRVWDWTAQQNRTTLSGHRSSVRCVRFCSSSSSLLCSGSLDGEVRLWSVPAVACVWHYQAHWGSVEALSFLTDGEMTLLSAGRDGTVQLWSAGFGRFASAVHGELQVQQRGFVCCPSGAVRALASGRSGCFFSVSTDRSLRAWSLSAVRPAGQRESLSAVCFLEKGELLVCGFSSGRLELWRHNSRIYSDKVNDGHIHAVTGMPDKQLAVSCSDCSVTVWKLELDPELCTAGLSKVSSYTLEYAALYLLYSNILLGVCMNASIVDIFSTVKETGTKSINNWTNDTQPLGVVKNDAKSFWVLGESSSELQLIFVISVVSGSCWYSDCCDIKLEWKKDNDSETEDSKSEGSREEQSEEAHEETQESEEPSGEYKQRKVWITAASIHEGFIVCGDARGYMWTNHPPNMTSWSEKRRAHSDKVSVLRLTDRAIISASSDGTVKLWDRNTKKQVGLFVCGAPVEILEVNEDDPSQLVCGDSLGQVYLLSWLG